MTSKSPEKPASRISPTSPDTSSGQDIAQFLKAAEHTRSVATRPSGAVAGNEGKKVASSGRLIFALDATMSRQPTWDRAVHIQSEMFQVAGAIAGLEIKLVYFRGFGECRASRWVESAKELGTVMRRISCQGGRTQIGKVLKNALEEAGKGRVSALVYVGDCMEENVDLLCERAGQLGLLKVPVFVFQEGDDPDATQAFAEIARLSGGVHCSFSKGSADRLAALLKAVAVYASGGRDALVALQGRGDHGARVLLEKLPRRG